MAKHLLMLRFSMLSSGTHRK